MRNIFYILFLFSIAFSCRKEKLKDEEEKLLVGNWSLDFVCSPCHAVGDKTILVIHENGLVDLYENDVEGKGRIARLEVIVDEINPNPVAPQQIYLFKVKMKKRNWFSKIDLLEDYNYFRYTSGDFDGAGNFVPGVRLQMKKQINGTLDGDMFFVKY